MRKMGNKSLLMTIAILIIAMSSVAQEKGTFKDPRDGKYDLIRINGIWWTLEEYDSTYSWYRCLRNNDAISYSSHNRKGDGYSVRGIKN